MEDYVSEFALLSLHSVDVYDEGGLETTKIEGVGFPHLPSDDFVLFVEDSFTLDSVDDGNEEVKDVDDCVIVTDILDLDECSTDMSQELVSINSVEIDEVNNAGRPSKRFVTFDFFEKV